MPQINADRRRIEEEIGRELTRMENRVFYLGIAPAGRPITLKGIAIYRVEGGKLMERWVVSDLYGVLEESGALSRIP